MVSLFVRLYNTLCTRRWAAFLSFAVLTAALALLVSRLHYKEDIADFLPLDAQHRQELAVYQDISGANRLFAVFQYNDSTHTDPQEAERAIDIFVEKAQEADTAHTLRGITAEIDAGRIEETAAFVYANMPYFLTATDYARMDSLLARSSFPAEQMERDRQLLMLPTAGTLAQTLGRDPLGLFTPVLQKLQKHGGELNYETQDGYIFSPDLRRAFVMVESPYGSSETDNNARLLAMLQTAADSATAQVPSVSVHFFGGPAIAVGNAHQIKSNSVLAVTIALVLILALLFLVFRRVWNLLLIVVSIGWGWLFAVGGLSLVHNDISIIVIGISSVVLGIAVNYPLHFIAHLQHTPEKRKALREIVTPLLVGNVTTVGAFLALVPLQSVALRDLGLFASFLLVGTILFVLIYLPHLAKAGGGGHTCRATFLDRLSDLSADNKPWLVWTVVTLTAVFGYFSLDTKFDANMAHINYMSPQQKADMEYFQREMVKNGTGQKVYAVSAAASTDSALDKSRLLRPVIDSMVAEGKVLGYTGCADFLTSHAEQTRRLALWRDFTRRHADLPARLSNAAREAGFADEAFADFRCLWEGTYAPQPYDYFAPLTTEVFASSLSTAAGDGTNSVVDALTVAPGHADEVERTLDAAGAHSFDVEKMNSAIANNLSDDFNYIGWACGFIVFFFLWLSFGSVELAMLSFLPMAVSWLWILGIMSLCGIQFNIVNVILATFIFGQGDDYTIFMTEGASYEYAYRRKMLASYKHSIVISALIMFIGIGTLIVASHPALRSLAQVTIAGMFSVVLMAYIFPPLIFKALVRTSGRVRVRPLSLRPLLVMAYSATVFMLQLLAGYAWGFTLFTLRKPTEHNRRRFRRFVHWCFRMDMRHIPGVTYRVDNPSGVTFARPAIVVSNHQSLLDPAIFLAYDANFVFVSNPRVGKNRLVGRILDWCGHITLPAAGEGLAPATVKRYTDLGYCVVIFAEGVRNGQSSIRRFHKGAFHVAEELGLDIIPALLHGANNVLPRNSWQVFSGSLTLRIYPRVPADLKEWGEGYVERTRAFHRRYINEYAHLAAQVETAEYFRPLITDRYRYKGAEVTAGVAKRLRRHKGYAAWVDAAPPAPAILVFNEGYGEFALLYALVHRHTKVMVAEDAEETTALLLHSAEGVAPNLQLVTPAAAREWLAARPARGTAVFAFAPPSEPLPAGVPLTIISADNLKN